MSAPVVLPTLSWGAPDAAHRALLIHGLGSNGALMWRFGMTLAEEGWSATAVDLRGHGVAPRALDCTLGAYGRDVSMIAPEDAGAWDLVIGHSLGGAASVLASAERPGWARRLVLIDPGIHLCAHDRAVVRASQARSFENPTTDAVRAEHPEWHELDIELKALSAQQASPWAVDQTSAQNPEWDVREAAARVTVPTHVIGADPAVYSIFTGVLAAEVLRNPAFSMSVIDGAGHSPHRDRPEATMAELRRVLAA